MTCISPPQLDDQELLAYFDGEAGRQVRAHLASCAHCRERARQLARVQDRLIALLYRVACPSPLEVGEYHLGVLPVEQRLALDRHLAECPHCRRELRQLEGYVAALAPDVELGPLERIKVLIARLVSAPEGQPGPGVPAPALAAAGLRGEGESLLLYQADGIHISLECQDEAKDRDRMILLGLVTGADTTGMEVQLWQPDQLIATAPVDPLGNFVVSDLIPGSYRLVLRGPEVEVQITELEIARD
jgi:hypothetical protein